MGSYQKLYLARNLKSLDLLAKKDFEYKNLTFQQITTTLKKLLKRSQATVLDQETTYILLSRYIMLLNHLKNTQKDEKFIQSRYAGESEKVSMQFDEIKKSLAERYTDKVKTIPSEEKKEPDAVFDVKSQRVFHDEFISCPQLFSALQNNKNILLVDARPDVDFAESKVNYSNCINVPDQIIVSGLSAHALGKRLSLDSQSVWKMRENFDVIVLYDWSTRSDNFSLTKLHKLRSALVDWDLHCEYKEPPVVLNGGYLELLETYPTLCINPLVYLSQKNNELDDLLDIDNIVYPTESDNKNLVMGAPEKDVESFDGDSEMKEVPIEENGKLAIDQKNVVEQIQNLEKKRKIIDDKCFDEYNINNIASMNTQVAEINNEIGRLKWTLPGDEPMEEDSQEILKDIIDEERNRQLKKARALKPTNKVNKDVDTGSSGSNSSTGVTTRRSSFLTPRINRATKPVPRPIPRVSSETTNSEPVGYNGLRNICNTCYINTVLQCLRNVPEFVHFCVKGIYLDYLLKNPAAIIHETAEVLAALRSTVPGVVDPIEFYNKVGQLEPTYKLGNHEDCMEFFLFLLNHLSEDSTYTTFVPKVMTPMQKAWYNQFEGRNSFFIDMFYHQIRIRQECLQCGKKTFKFEIESTFMLPVPDTDFCLDTLIDEYMADFVIPEYCCSNCKKPVKNRKELCYEPKVMVLVLKRYKQCIENGVVAFQKTSSKAYFPKKNFRLGKCHYKLSAIALHSGDMSFGHYYAVGLTPQGWMEFNDEHVKPVNINDDFIKTKACAFFYSTCDQKKF